MRGREDRARLAGRDGGARTTRCGARRRSARRELPGQRRALPARLPARARAGEGRRGRANAELGVLDAAARARDRAPRRRGRRRGALDAQFPVDVFQTGSGTSTNMNANEVIARARASSCSRRATPQSVHPNDHVNASQSSNDVIPTALHVAARLALRDDLVPALARAASACCARKARGLRRRGEDRPHAPDGRDAGAARPGVRGLGAPGRARRASGSRARSEALAELALGGTAVGTGLNARPASPRARSPSSRARPGSRFAEARDHFEAQGARDACVEASGALRTLAVSLAKIANDVRLLASGPALRARRARAARDPARLVDHARQGEPGDLRGRCCRWRRR